MTAKQAERQIEGGRERRDRDRVQRESESEKKCHF